MLSFESLDSIFGRPAAAVSPEAVAAARLEVVIGVAALLLLGQLTEMLLLLASDGFPVDTGFTVIFILPLGNYKLNELHDATLELG